MRSLRRVYDAGDAASGRIGTLAARDRRQSPTPVIRSDAHLGHAGLIELMAGRDALLRVAGAGGRDRASAPADGGFAFEEPDAFGTDPILAVHDAALVRSSSMPGPMHWPPATSTARGR